MSPNGKYGDEQIRQLDKAMKGELTGNDLLDNMAATVPQADPAFENRLEEMLIAQLAQTQHGGSHNMQADRPITQLHVPRQNQQHETTTIPLTLVAAVLLMIVAGAILIFANKPPAGPEEIAGYAAQGETTEEPTALPPTALPSLCTVMTINEVPLFTQANQRSTIVAEVGAETTLEVFTHTTSSDDTNAEWYFVRELNTRETPVEGWILAVNTQQVTPCPASLLFPVTATPVRGDTNLMPAVVPYTEVPANSSIPTPSPIPTLRPGECVVYQGPGTILYTVEEGDTLASIAEGFDIDPFMLISVNCLQPEDIPAVGHDLVIPPGNMSQLQPAVIPSLIPTPTPIMPTVPPPPDSTVNPPLENLRPIVVAAQDIHRAQKLTEGMLMVVYYPVEDIPTDAFDNMDGITNQYTLEAIHAGQPIVEGDITIEAFLNPLSKDGTGPYELPNNKVAVMIPVDAGQGRNFKVGDRLTVIAAFIFVDVDSADSDPESVEPPNELDMNQPIIIPEGGSIMLQTVASDADFIIRGQTSTDDSETQQDVITIAVTPQEAEILTWMIEAKIPYTIVKTG